MQQSLEESGDEGDEQSPDEQPQQLFIVRIVDDQVEISADSSGQLLHRRGYRQEVAKAPLRETLAAAMVLASGWRRNEKLLDPLCGSGAIPIEAALIARNIAPGLARDFEFTRWPSFDARRWESITADARAAMIDGGVNVLGADRDAGAIAAAERNSERAGVGADIQFSVASLSDSLGRIDQSADLPVWVLANPPYGVRVGDAGELRDLYSTLGNAVRGHPARRIGILTADQALAGQLRISLRSRFDSRNGGIPVSFLVSEKAQKDQALSPERAAGRKAPR